MRCLERVIWTGCIIYLCSHMNSALLYFSGEFIRIISNFIASAPQCGLQITNLGPYFFFLLWCKSNVDSSRTTVLQSVFNAKPPTHKFEYITQTQQKFSSVDQTLTQFLPPINHFTNHCALSYEEQIIRSTV